MKTYRSRIGWEIWIPVAFIFGIEAYIFIINSIWIGLAIITCIATLIVFYLITMKYIISNGEKFIIKSWFSNYEIDIKSIHRIRKTSNPISSPAASFIGRIEIHYNNGKTIIISPNQKEEFISDLLYINKAILTFEAR